jgi:phage gpG-like protein
MISQTVDEFAADMERQADAFGTDLTPAMKECAEIVHTDIRTNFQEAVTPDGVAWAPRKDEGFSHPLLNLSGALMDAATGEGAGAITRIGPDSLEIGVDASVDEGGLPGAFVHQFGATILPVTKRFLSWLNSSGERVFAKQVTIPPREYLGFSPDASDRCTEAIADHVMEGLT